MAKEPTEIKLPERPGQSRKQLPNFDVAVSFAATDKRASRTSLASLKPLSLYNSECFRALCHRDKSRMKRELIGGRSGDHKGIIVRLSPGENSISSLFKVYYLQFYPDIYLGN